MDKYIKAQDLIDRIYPVDSENDGSDGCTAVYQNLTLSSPEIEAIVEELPAADVAPVVRCRECLHYTDWGACGRPDNGWDAPKMGPEDFCSRGERKADGN